MLTSKPKIYKIHQKEKIDTEAKLLLCNVHFMQRVYDQQRAESVQF